MVQDLCTNKDMERLEKAVEITLRESLKARWRTAFNFTENREIIRLSPLSHKYN